MTSRETVTATKVGELHLLGDGITLIIPEARFLPKIDTNPSSTHQIAKLGYVVAHDDTMLWITDH